MMCFISWPLVVVLICHVNFGLQTDNDMEYVSLEEGRTQNASRILNKLLTNYDNRLRPKFGGRPVVVHVGVYIVDIGEISVTKMDYRMTLYFRQTWEDPRLRFNNTDQIIAQGNLLEKIWTPDSYFINEKRSNFHEVTKKNYYLRLFSNGTVNYSIRVSLTLICRMNLRKYPMDTQKCQLNIMSYSYSKVDAIYTWKQGLVSSVERSDGISLPQMDLLHIEASETTDTFFNGNFSRLMLVFTFKRRLSLFITETYIPSIMIVALSWISFWINYKAAPARVALCITTVLTMITLTAAVRNSLPRVTYTKYSDWILMTSLMYVFGALVEFAIINFYDSLEIRRKEEGDKENSVVDLENRGAEASNGKAKSSDLENAFFARFLTFAKVMLLMEDEVNVRKIDKTSRVLFPLSFIIVNLSFWIYFTVDSSYD